LDSPFVFAGGFRLAFLSKVDAGFSQINCKFNCCPSFWALGKLDQINDPSPIEYDFLFWVLLTSSWSAWETGNRNTVDLSVPFAVFQFGSGLRFFLEATKSTCSRIW